MGHAGAEVRPAHSFDHRLRHLFAFACSEISSGGANKAFDIELRLLLDAVIQKHADVGVVLKGLVDLARRSPAAPETRPSVYRAWYAAILPANGS